MPILDKHGLLPPDHQVPDLLAPDLKLVFCGTALGRVSAQKKAYYANPGNYFWRTLHEIGLTPRRIAPADYRQLLDDRIGLTDICKRHYGNDGELPSEAFDAPGLRAKIELFQPAILAFTSKRGASEFLGRRSVTLGFQPEAIGRTRIYVLCSPSGQARIYWRAEVWQALAQAVGAAWDRGGTAAARRPGRPPDRKKIAAGISCRIDSARKNPIW